MSVWVSEEGGHHSEYCSLFQICQCILRWLVRCNVAAVAHGSIITATALCFRSQGLINISAINVFSRVGTLPAWMNWWSLLHSDELFGYSIMKSRLPKSCFKSSMVSIPRCNQGSLSVILTVCSACDAEVLASTVKRLKEEGFLRQRGKVWPPSFTSRQKDEWHHCYSDPLTLIGFMVSWLLHVAQ